MLTVPQLSDHVEITQLLYRYGRAIDARDLTMFDTIFAPDAVVDYAVPGGTALPLPAMTAWLRESLAIFRATQHAMSSPVIELDGDRARASTYVTAVHVQVAVGGEESRAVLYGVYTDELARGPDGWRITRRRLDARIVDGAFLAPDQARRFTVDKHHG
jgi:hypothetical protein